MVKDLSYYKYCFTHLNRDGKNGGAPHKPILLISILELFAKGIFNDEHIFIVPELVAAFKTNWSRLVITNHHPIFALPFYHMRSESFWSLVPNNGCEKWIEAKGAMRSFSNLTTAINYVLIDKELSELLLQTDYRLTLLEILLNKYFPTTQNFYDTNDNNLESISFLEESGETYKQKIIELRQNVDENTFQELVFIRSGIFKREVPKIYNNTCAISELRVDIIANVSMIDACHIVPFSEGYNDTLTNGIALCPNLHRAFDRGLIAISDDYSVLVKSTFIENTTSVFNLCQFNGKKILLPHKKEHFPSLENIRYHRKKFGFT